MMLRRWGEEGQEPGGGAAPGAGGTGTRAAPSPQVEGVLATVEVGGFQRRGADPKGVQRLTPPRETRTGML